MKLQTVRITNFRTIREDEFYLYPYMVFVGKNNAGKSNLMKALDVFFGRKPTEADFRLEGDTRVETFTITVTFVDLSPGERALYSGKTLYPGTPKEQLVLRQTVSSTPKNDVNYEYGTHRYQLDTPAAQSRYGFLYNEALTSKTKFLKDPKTPDEFKDQVRTFIEHKKAGGGSGRLTQDEITQLKTDFMVAHPEMQELPADLIFADAGIPKTKTKRYLGTYFFIPAVQDIDEETTYKARGKTNINKLMNYLLDQMRDPLKEHEQNARIQAIMRDIYQLEDSESALNQVAADLNEILHQFDGSSIRFDTELPSINKLVRDSLQIYMDDGVETAVADKGHGLQRYFMVSLFKLWGDVILKRQRQTAQSANPRSATGSATPIKPVSKCTSVYFAIEEPELFLHPQYQLLMRNYLETIAFTDDHQVLLNTHSPNFIDFNNYKAVVKVEKTAAGMYPETHTLQPVIERDGQLQLKDIIHAHGRERHKFHQINQLNLSYYMNPHRSQLFFADTVVLVEGETEKIMFPKWAEYFLPEAVAERFTTTYVDCGGKYNMQLYQEMLNGFQIPYVVIIDDDHGSGDPHMAKLNHFIQKMADEGNGHVILLDQDFEHEFGITGHEVDQHGNKKFKPFQAFRTFFAMDATQTPNVKALEQLRNHPKLRQIFLSIYRQAP